MAADLGSRDEGDSWARRRTSGGGRANLCERVDCRAVRLRNPISIPRHILASIYILRDGEYLPERASQSQGRSTRRALFHQDGFHRTDRTPQSMGLTLRFPRLGPGVPLLDAPCLCLSLLVVA